MSRTDAPPLRLDQLAWGYTADRPFGSGLDLTVRGEMIAIVGPNGAGKSTLLRTICGRLPPMEGKILLGGEAVDALLPPQRARRVALLSQAPLLDLDLCVRELVELGRTPHLGAWGRLGPGDREAVERAIAWCGLEELAGRRLGQISGGERQRAQIALTLAQEAPLLLLDEPTTHLDLRRRFELFELLARLRAESGLALVVVLHDLEDAYRECDRVLVLDGAAVEEVGADDLERRAKLARAFNVPEDRI